MFVSPVNVIVVFKYQLHNIHQQSNASKHPLHGGCFRSKARSENVSWAAHLGLVHGAHVRILLIAFVDGDGFD
jgi:hypothetical protein